MKKRILSLVLVLCMMLTYTQPVFATNNENELNQYRQLLNENYEKEQTINSIKSRFSKEIILQKYEEVLLNII